MASSKGNKDLTFEERLQREWQNPEIRAEFLEDFAIFEAFKRAEEQGRFSYQFTDNLDLKKLIDILSKQPYRDLEPVKRLTNTIRNRLAGEAKRDSEGAVKQTIRIIMEKTCSDSFNDLLIVMEDEDQMDELFHARTNPTPLQIISVDRVADKIKYKKKREEKTVSFSRVRSVVSKIKKS